MFEHLFWLGFVGAALALGFAVFQAYHVLKAPQGSGEIQKITLAIRQGTKVYLIRHYLTVLVLFLLVFLGLFGLTYYGLLDNPYIPYAFLSGGILSALSGFVGIQIAIRANSRTACALSEGLDRGLSVAFSSGTVMGFTVVGLGLLEVTVWFHVLKYSAGYDADQIARTMVMFGLGASLMALFSRLGGGIFAKAADVGAGLLNQMGTGVPQDDPRNPAAIADQVGDNVGDVAGMGADLYESYVVTLPAALALGAWAYTTDGMTWRAMLLPLIVAVTGAFSSLLGSFLIRTKAHADLSALLGTLRKGLWLVAALTTLVLAPVTYLLMGSLQACLAILIGLLSACLICYCTERFTSEVYRPTRRLSAATETGPATAIMGGLSLGMKSTVAPMVILILTALVAFVSTGGFLNWADPLPQEAGFARGLYGVGLAAVSMLSPLGLILSAHAYGPVVDSAHGIVRMAGLGEGERDRADALDALGNTAAATGKGFAAAAAALASLVLLAAYVNLIQTGTEVLDLTLTNPNLLVGVFLGVVVAFLFASLTLSAVQRCARSMVSEVRRQFKEIRGILSGKNEPNYTLCVDRCTKWALFRMAAPSLLAVATPLGIGFLLGPTAVAGLLLSVTVTGFALSLFLSNTGSAWGNARKYMESSSRGGTGSDQHIAAIIGDTVGDPCKDVAGPSLNVLIKLSAILSLVFSSLLASQSLLPLL